MKHQLAFHISSNPRCPHGSTVNAAGHTTLTPLFELQLGYIWTLFRHSLRPITFGSRSAHLAYRVHKSGRKTVAFILSCSPTCVSIIYNCYQVKLLHCDVVSCCVIHGTNDQFNAYGITLPKWQQSGDIPCTLLLQVSINVDNSAPNMLIRIAIGFFFN